MDQSNLEGRRIRHNNQDDGHGMSGEEIIQAMRPGAQNPLEERSATDLGRFGLGLKTASFSQCRTLTVMSKIQGQSPEFWTWSLDHVARCDRWELVHWLPGGFEHELDNLASGTIVIWTDPDRIIPAATKAENENAKRKFSEAFDRVKKHLSMTFHRFLEAKSVAIHWCGHEIDDKYKGSCITKVWANGDFENLGEINLKGSNKTFVANTKQKTASY